MKDMIFMWSYCNRIGWGRGPLKIEKHLWSCSKAWGGEGLPRERRYSVWGTLRDRGRLRADAFWREERWKKLLSRTNCERDCENVCWQSDLWHNKRGRSYSGCVSCGAWMPGHPTQDWLHVSLCVAGKLLPWLKIPAERGLKTLGSWQKWRTLTQHRRSWTFSHLEIPEPSL